MKLDKELYRQAYESLRRWSEAVDAERARKAGQLGPAEAWQQYVALVEFCWRLCPQPSEHQQQEKMEAAKRYYERLRRLEDWRRGRGKTT